MKVVVIKKFLGLAFFSEGQQIFPVHCILGFHRLQSQHITAQSLASPRISSTSATLLRASRLLLLRLGLLVSIGAYISKYRALLCVLLTHVWKPALKVRWKTIIIFILNLCVLCMISLWLLWIINNNLLTMSPVDHESVLSILSYLSFHFMDTRISIVGIWRLFSLQCIRHLHAAQSC